MKYFTKYLPVKGDVKQGDKYLYPAHSTRGEEDVFNCTDDTGTVDYSDCLKVKLYLCSIDGFLYDNEDKHTVIGEISPQAIWVKEGHKFEEDNVQISKHPECPLCEAWANDGFCPHDVDCQILKARTIVRILCPTCKNFH